MADSKISALSDGSPRAAGDAYVIARSGQNYQIPNSQFQGLDGWVDDTAETWTYASGSGGGAASFTIASVDLTAKYTKGTRIKLTQTTVKYFVVTSSSFSTNTTVNIMAGSDYTLANASISANYHSYDVNPQGWPGWFIFAPSPTGWSGTPTVGRAKFNVIGTLCFLDWRITGTSNSTAAGMTAPIACLTEADGVGVNIAATLQTDNSVTVTSPGRAVIASASTAVTFSKDFGGGAFTNSGTKAITGFGSYPI